MGRSSVADNLRDLYLRHGCMKKDLLNFSPQALRALADEYQLKVLTPQGKSSLNKMSLASALIAHVRSSILWAFC